MNQSTRRSRSRRPDADDAFLLRVLDSVDHPFLVIQAADHRVLFANEVSGGEAVLGRPCYAVTHGRETPCDTQDDACPLQIVRSEGVATVVEHRHRQRASDGSMVERVVDVHAHPIFDAQGELHAIVEYSIDVSDRKALQAKLVQADRLVTMGILSAGIAHELRTPLTYIGANLEMLEESLRELEDAPLDEREALKQEAREALKDAREGVGRMREIVASVRGLSRTNASDNGELVELGGVIDTALKIANSEIKYRARVTLELEPLPSVRGSEGKLAQVFLNLLINAAQAIEQGAPERNQILIRARAHAGKAYVEIHDSGCGIRPENLDRVFEPFFTTKPASIGTGLGLHLCRQIVEEMGGTITVASTRGEGSTFVLSLPAASS